MEETIYRPTRKCPRENASFLSKFCFWWMRKTFVSDARKDFELEDIFCPLENDGSERNTDFLESVWKTEVEKREITERVPNSKKKSVASKQPSLLRAIWIVFWWDFIKAGIVMLIMSAGFRTLQIVLVARIIRYFNGDGSNSEIIIQEVLYYATILILITGAIIACNHHSNLHVRRVAMRVSVACTSLIYRKILRLSKSALNQTKAEEIISLFTSDGSLFDESAALINHLWIFPIQVFVFGVVMYIFFGYFAFVGLAVMLLLILPIQIIVNGFSKFCQPTVTDLTDRRMKIIEEIINGIQVVKIHAWETPFTKLVTKARAFEMRAIRNINHLRSFSLALSIFSDKLSLFLTLLAYVLMGNEITAELAFSIGMFFCVLQSSSTCMFPQAVMQANKTVAFVNRLQDFLLLNELPNGETWPEVEELQDEPASLSRAEIFTSSVGSMSTITELSEKSADEYHLQEVFVEMQRMSANWESGQLPPTLCDVSIKIYGGELCALVGKVGSGKSSLLSVLSKELPIGSGNVFLRQSFNTEYEEFYSKSGYVVDNKELVISYASQEPWLFSGTVRDNILFGQSYNSSRYHEVIKACALSKEIEQWPKGDMTTVGNAGTELTIGQKSRINLARATYKKADLYLLDDPLTSVEEGFARCLYERCVDGILKGKTRILATHRVQLLKNADTIVVLERGLMRAQGTFEELNASSEEFVCLLNNGAEGKEESYTDDEKDETDIETKPEHSNNLTKIQPPEVPQEETASLHIWKRYFRAGASLPTLLLLFVTLLLLQITLTGTDLWIGYWTNLEAVRSNLNDSEIVLTIDNYTYLTNETIFRYFNLTSPDGLLSQSTALKIYSSLILLCILVIFAQNFLFFAICSRASENLHKSMLGSILRAAMRFFETHSPEKILRRFSKDTETMDQLLPTSLLLTIRSVLLINGILCLSVVINLWMILPTFVLLLAFNLITKRYFETISRIKRFHSKCKSPALEQVIASLGGLATIRSGGSSTVQYLRNRFDAYQDIHSGVWYMTIATTASYRFWVDFLALWFFTCMCYSLILLEDGIQSGCAIGLLLSQSIQLIGTLHTSVEESLAASGFMRAIERISQYTEIEAEGPPVSEDALPDDWPTKGRISMKNVSFRSDREDSLVLKGLNLTIEAGWRVGFIDRSGVGKNVLLPVILRLENDNLEGEIKIDGRDTATLAPGDLRSRISVIPREPALFSGTLRSNLDPFDSHDDSVLWEALREVELSYLHLDEEISERGSNLSVDQRQLICLARAILRTNRILILDDATANVDERTGALIHDVLKRKFARHTIVNVARRLISIIESDRVAVIDGGEIIEFGCPYELLCEYPNGPFAQMVHESGPTATENLIQLAEAACLRVLPEHSLDLTSNNSGTYLGSSPS